MVVRIPSEGETADVLRRLVNLSAEVEELRRRLASLTIRNEKRHTNNGADDHYEGGKQLENKHSDADRV